LEVVPFKGQIKPSENEGSSGVCFQRPVAIQTESLALRHLSLQYRTCSQHRSHFFRHANGRWHAEQIFVGRLGFLWGI